ncbi:hypothetical protein PISL3812_00048 [Talaromyces islandicus]|uniref:Uncharacterized protein n=1 Tax=Talaromyces islandicus TaxID=28573 RepID=A0A0U1LI64_TALIS|nr:hypothetical protein PISL3812_00048 [Talaromyces islandicus]
MVEQPDTTSDGYPQGKLNTIRVYKQRGHYDYETVHSITDSTLLSHVAFIIKDNDNNGEDTPVNIPLTCVLGRYNPDIDYESLSDEQLDAEHKQTIHNGPVEAYVHGNAAAMLYKAIKSSEDGSVKVCITSTAVDGIVLFLTPNGHSLNYRSSVIHGTASLVPEHEVAKKRWSMRLLTNHMARGRWDVTYPVAQSAIEYVQVIEVHIRSASAKVRGANIGDFEPDTVLGQSPGWEQKDVWSGVVPLYELLGTPVSSEVMGSHGNSESALQQVESWRRGRNKASRQYAESVAAVGPVEKDMKEQVEKWKSGHS